MPPTSKQAPQGTGRNPKNIIIASVAVIAIIFAGAMVYITQFRETPPPPQGSDVMSGATAEEQNELKNQQKLHQSLEKKLKPAGA